MLCLHLSNKMENSKSKPRLKWGSDEISEMLNIIKKNYVKRLRDNRNKRNIGIYYEISKKIRRKGFNKNAEQTRSKFKSLKCEYIKFKKSGNMVADRYTHEHFDLLDDILCGGIKKVTCTDVRGDRVLYTSGIVNVVDVEGDEILYTNEEIIKTEYVITEPVSPISTPEAMEIAIPITSPTLESMLSTLTPIANSPASIPPTINLSAPSPSPITPSSTPIVPAPTPLVASQIPLVNSPTPRIFSASNKPKRQIYERALASFTTEWKKYQDKFLYKMKEQDEKYLKFLSEQQKREEAMLKKHREESEKILERDRLETQKMLSSLLSSFMPTNNAAPFASTQSYNTTASTINHVTESCLDLNQFNVKIENFDKSKNRI